MKDLEKSQFDPEEVVRDLSGAEQHFLKFNSANFCLVTAHSGNTVAIDETNCFNNPKKESNTSA